MIHESEENKENMDENIIIGFKNPNPSSPTNHDQRNVNSLPRNFHIPKIDMRKIGVYIREQFFEARIKRLRNRAIMEYLIKWKNFPVEDVTWEDDYFIQKHPDILKH